MKITVEIDVRVFLPVSFEFDDRLDQIFTLAFQKGASETSTIGPWILFVDSDRQTAIDTVESILKELDIR